MNKLWIRNRKHGTRRELYAGSSQSKAKEIAEVAMQIAGEFKLTCTIVIYDKKGDSIFEKESKLEAKR